MPNPHLPYKGAPTQSETPAEAKMKIGDQWYYRGNKSPSWFFLHGRPDGSTSGISERVPADWWPLLESLTAERAARLELQHELAAVREGFQQIMASRQEYSDAAVAAERALAERHEYWQQKCETAWQRGDEQGQQVVKLCLENADLERALAEARRDAERLKAENAGLERATTLLSERLAVAAALAGERDAG